MGARESDHSDARAERADAADTLEELERAENWALVVLLAWLAILLYAVAALLFTDALWGPVVGLVLWSVGARGVLASFRRAAARTAEARSGLREGRTVGDDDRRE